MTTGPEHEQQKALFNWAAMESQTYPELALMYAIPNGGHRHKRTAGRLKAEGVKAGVPDIHLPVPTNDYAGLWVEMKVKPNRPTPHQMWWLEKLEAAGHRAIVCYDWIEAKEAITDYLGER